MENTAPGHERLGLECLREPITVFSEYMPTKIVQNYFTLKITVAERQQVLLMKRILGNRMSVIFKFLLSLGTEG